MSDEKSEKIFDWSYDAYLEWGKNRLRKEQALPRKTQIINFLINCAIGLSFILGFIGFIVFPQVMIPGSLLLTGCLIASQALSGFGILATLVKAAHAVYEMGWKKTLRMLRWLPKQSFNAYAAQSILLLLGFIAIAIIIALSATGVIYIPFLTVFAANALSLEVLEVLWGLISDIAAISVGVMTCYLISQLGKSVDEGQRGRIDISINENEADEKSAEEYDNPLENKKLYDNHMDDSLADSADEKLSGKEEEEFDFQDQNFTSEENQQKSSVCFPCNLI